MLNREKYAEEIIEIALQGNSIAKTRGILVTCRETKCALCDFNGPIDPDCCEYKRLEWANSEYIEPPVDWSKVSVDTPILVRQSESNEWVRRSFAKYENNMVYTWEAGTTSWSAGGPVHITDWKYAKLAESED